MRIVPFILVAALALGCGNDGPTLAGGKPVSHWLEALKQPDAKVRRTAVRKLGSVGPSDTAVLPALLGALQDRDAAVRREAILALVKCGPNASEALPALTAVGRHDPDAEVRAYAARALRALRAGE